MTASTETTPDTATIEAIEQAYQTGGPAAAIDRLVQTLEETGPARALLDALLVKARFDLGLPLVQASPLAEIPEPTRTQYEDRYVDAIRHVGQKLLDAGSIVEAWPYYRTIGEPKPVADAIDRYQLGEDEEQVGSVIEVALSGGANPRRGFELVLEHYGICSSITAFEHLSPADEALRADCAAKLVKALHEQLVDSLRAEITRRGQPMPAEGTSIEHLMRGRDWLMADDAYHIDTSHLASVVRMGLLLTDLDTIRMAVDLTEYGRRLSGRHRYEGEPPFERLYEDHAAYMRAVLGEQVDEAIVLFQGKIPPPDPDGQDDSTAAQVLVRLLSRIGRLDEAIDVAAEHLAGLPEAALFCPSLSQLCARAGRLDRLTESSRSRGDLVPFTASLVSKARP